MSDTYVETNISQYEGIDISGLVPARYICPSLDIDRGDPYIEALPRPSGRTCRICGLYAGSLATKEGGPGELDRIMWGRAISETRITLPFQQNLERYLYRTLVGSYRSRRRSGARFPGIPYQYAGETRYTTRALFKDVLGSPPEAFCLEGIPGCGKSTAIGAAVSHYPQVIIHENDSGGEFAQVVYLYSRIPHKCGSDGLAMAFGEALDAALDNTAVYGKEISAAHGHSEKEMLVKQYIKQLAIGILIVDDAQNLDNKAVSTLFSFMEDTGVGLLLAGTDEMADTIYKDLWTARRAGPTVRADSYCTDRKFFDTLVRDLIQCQKFGDRIEPTDDISDALYEATKGAIGPLIEAYAAVGTDYMGRSGSPEIDGEYVRNILTKQLH